MLIKNNNFNRGIIFSLTKKIVIRRGLLTKTMLIIKTVVAGANVSTMATEACLFLGGAGWALAAFGIQSLRVDNYAELDTLGQLSMCLCIGGQFGLFIIMPALAWLYRSLRLKTNKNNYQKKKTELASLKKRYVKRTFIKAKDEELYEKEEKLRAKIKLNFAQMLCNSGNDAGVKLKYLERELKIRKKINSKRSEHVRVMDGFIKKKNIHIDINKLFEIRANIASLIESTREKERWAYELYFFLNYPTYYEQSGGENAWRVHLLTMDPPGSVDTLNLNRCEIVLLQLRKEEEDFKKIGCMHIESAC